MPTVVNLTGKDNPESDKPKSSPKQPTQTEDRALRGRLVSVFDRIATAAEARGDDELAGIIREDTEVMAAGLVSLTRPIRALRAPIIIALGIIEPVMAFSRVARVMLGRAIERRHMRHEAEDTDIQ